MSETLIKYGTTAVVSVVLAIGTVFALVPPEEKVEQVPTTGEQGYPVAAFCADPATTVRDTTIPGVSEQTYELVRLKNNVQESVIWIGTGSGATHWYYDSAGVQQSEPAVVDEDAKKCIERKAQ